MTTKEQGLSLMDIAGASEDVPMANGFLRVYGISTQDGLAIFRRFPTLTAMVGGEFKATSLVTLAPEAISAILAAGVGKIGDEETEAAARKIGMEVQYDILEAIGRLTFKNGFGPFVARIMVLAKSPDFANSGKVRATNSPQESKPSLQPDTLPESSGDTLPDK